jgi:hypothetical protein
MKFFVASLIVFAPGQFLERIVTADETWVKLRVRLGNA